MEQGTLLKIAKLRTLAAKHGKAFDVVRFASDRSFARQTLSGLMDTEDETLLMAGLQMMEALRMTGADEEKPAPVPVVEAGQPLAQPAPPLRSALQNRYVGRLR